MILVIVSLKDKLDKIWLFEKTLLIANISIEVILAIRFFSFNNANIEYTKVKVLT